MLRRVSEILQVGVLTIGRDGPVAENAVMERLAAEFGGLAPFVNARVRGDGECRLAQRIFQIRHAAGVDAGMLLVEDVTEQRRIEESRHAFSQFPAQNPSPVLRVGAHGAITHANRAAEPLLQAWGTTVGGRVPAPYGDMVAATLDSGWGRSVEVEANGRILSLSLVPLREEGYLNIYGSDVTDRVAAERRLHNITEWLDRQIAERTRDLEEARVAAEMANRAKSEFLAAVSHELRTPLNAVIGFSEVMADEMFGPMANERYREYAADILASGRHLLEVINDILDISRIESGHTELARESVDPGAIVRAAERLLAPRAQAAAVSVRTEVAPDLPPLCADRRRLLQIVVNLLSNAVKFTPAGGAVRVTARREGGEMLIEVADTGIGMDSGQIRAALEPFRQVDAGFARRYEGTGLGLPLAQSFAELHGGTLAIASAPQAGTVVTVRLPVAESQPCPAAMAAG